MELAARAYADGGRNVVVVRPAPAGISLPSTGWQKSTLLEGRPGEPLGVRVRPGRWRIRLIDEVAGGVS